MVGAARRVRAWNDVVLCFGRLRQFMPGHRAATRLVACPKANHLARIRARSVLRLHPDVNAQPVLAQRFSGWDERGALPIARTSQTPVGMAHAEKAIYLLIRAEVHQAAKSTNETTRHSEKGRAMPLQQRRQAADDAGFDQDQQLNGLSCRAQLLSHLEGNGAATAKGYQAVGAFGLNAVQRLNVRGCHRL